MMKLEQQAFKIQDIMYDSMTKHNFDSISDAVDRVSDSVDSNLDKVDTNNIKPMIVLAILTQVVQIMIRT